MSFYCAAAAYTAMLLGLESTNAVEIKKRRPEMHAVIAWSPSHGSEEMGWAYFFYRGFFERVQLDFFKTGLVARFLVLSVVTIWSVFATGCSTTPVLHVIGVHEGKTPPGVDDRPWWAKCNDDQKNGKPDDLPRPTVACHMMHAGKGPEKEVVVNVSDSSKPIVLALNAYNKTHWKVSTKDGVRITKVILSGYHSQRVSGIPAETLVETYTHESSPCGRCRQSPKYFYSYEVPPEQLKEITGLEVTSFQGAYKGTEFSVFDGLRN